MGSRTVGASHSCVCSTFGGALQAAVSSKVGNMSTSNGSGKSSNMCRLRIWEGLRIPPTWQTQLFDNVIWAGVQGCAILSTCMGEAPGHLQFELALELENAPHCAKAHLPQFARSPSCLCESLHLAGFSPCTWWTSNCANPDACFSSKAWRILPPSALRRFPYALWTW